MITTKLQSKQPRFENPGWSYINFYDIFLYDENKSIMQRVILYIINLDMRTDHWLCLNSVFLHSDVKVLFILHLCLYHPMCSKIKVKELRCYIIYAINIMDIICLLQIETKHIKWRRNTSFSGCVQLGNFTSLKIMDQWLNLSCSGSFCTSRYYIWVYGILIYTSPLILPLT